MKLDEKVAQQVKWNPYSHNFKLLTCMLYLKKNCIKSLNTYIYIDRGPSQIAVKVILILFSMASLFILPLQHSMY